MPFYWYIGWRKKSIESTPPAVVSVADKPEEAKKEGDDNLADKKEGDVATPSSQPSANAPAPSKSTSDKTQQLTDVEKASMRSSLTMSSWFEFVVMLYMRSPPPSLSSWKLFNRQDSFMACMIFALVPLLLNEIGVVLMLPTSLFLLLQSSGQRDDSARSVRTRIYAHTTRIYAHSTRIYTNGKPYVKSKR